MWCVVGSNSTDSCCSMEYVNHTGKQFWNNLIVFRLGVREASDVLRRLRTTCCDITGHPEDMALTKRGRHYRNVKFVL